MASIQIMLKKVNTHEWQLFAPKGHPIGPRFKGEEYKALEWAAAYVSTWSNWVVYTDKGDENEKTD